VRSRLRVLRGARKISDRDINILVANEYFVPSCKFVESVVNLLRE
jgi:hypothetical protein